jgi:adenylate cyclase
MDLWKKSMLIAAVSALFFAFLYIAGTIFEDGDFFTQAEERVYDLFLRFRPARERLDNVVFIDVDDLSIAQAGVFPWPRSVMGDGILRLKEYGVEMAVFDIEYIDQSPPGLDAVYLNRNLPGDFSREFLEISTDVKDLFDAILAGRLPSREAAAYGSRIVAMIDEKREELLSKTYNVARDNDEYLAQAARLFGKAWFTVNMQQEFPLTGEQAERRPAVEQKFAYPVEAAPGVHRGGDVDVLAPIPPIIDAARGGGFTNVTIDKDGVRRRISLAREVNGYWYLQLALAPLMEYLGDPALLYTPGRITLKGAQVPGESGPVDIKIPLDRGGAMMLDWPLTDYRDSFSHLSFAFLSYLDEYEGQLQDSISELFASPVWSFSPHEVLFDAYKILNDLHYFFEVMDETRRLSLSQNSDEQFEAYLSARAELRQGITEFISLGTADQLRRTGAELSELYPEESELINSEIDRALSFIEALDQIFAQVLEIEKKIRETISGKICIIGRSDTGTTDIGVNPFWGRYVNVGTHGVVLDTILSRSFITPLGKEWSILLTLILVPLILILTSLLKPDLRIVLGFVSAVFFPVFSFVLFYARGIFLGPLGMTLAVLVAVIIREAIVFAGSDKERRATRDAFSKYLSPEVVREVLADPSHLKLGGSKRYMSALFTDIMGFSTIAEKLEPEDLVSLLNDYLSALSNVVLDQKGTIDKYEGDAILAFFGAPLDLPDHALRVCTSAIRMKRIEAELNKKYSETGLSPSPLFTRIGINTGSMVVGNMGTESKMDYTIMGNAVNLASRLESANKQYGTWILSGDYTIKTCGDSIVSRRLDKVRVMGIQEPVQLYEILDIRGEASQEVYDRIGLFEEALAIFENRDWKKAQAVFMKILDRFPGDGPSKVFVERCQHYAETPPENGWDGIYTLKEK